MTQQEQWTWPSSGRGWVKGITIALSPVLLLAVSMMSVVSACAGLFDFRRRF